jgi:hypothetical protein
VPNSITFARIDRLLACAERQIALLDRCRPLNAQSETERVIEAWENGRATTPEYRYGPPPDLSELMALLETVATSAATVGPVGELYGARALELLREARVVEALSTAAFRDRARERFPVDAGADGRDADATAARWVAVRPPMADRHIVSDDDRDPSSLLSAVRALVGSMRLPIRVSTTSDLACAAAAGDGFILVQRGLRLRPESARRTALHEVLGHAAPRTLAKTETLGLFAVGAARGSEDEEGRALLIEERHGLLDAERRRELAARHLAALAVREGADWVETVRRSIDLGFSPREAVRMAARVLRGGGLARELVYLPARGRVKSALESDPRLERWLERGRIGIDAARALQAFSAKGGDDGGVIGGLFSTARLDVDVRIDASIGE